MNTNEKRLVTLLVLTMVFIVVTRIPNLTPIVFTLVISIVSLIGLGFLLPQLCLWSKLYEKGREEVN